MMASSNNGTPDSLPVLDYSEKDRASKARKIVQIMETVGFLYLDNVPGYSEDGLKWCLEFFYDVMPAEKKLQMAKDNPENKNVYWGYYSSDPCESHRIGKDLPKDDPDYESSYPLSEHSPWPQASPGEDNAPYEKFKRTMEEYFSLYLEVALELTKLTAMGLGLNENYFDCLFTKTASTLKILNYPVRDLEMSLIEHVDSSFLTLLCTFDNEGLQVKREDNSWLDVVPRKNSLIVNLGNISSKMTDDRLKATIHRVLAIRRTRRSAGFFLHPSFHALVPYKLPSDKTMKSAAENLNDGYFEYGPYMMKFLHQFDEFKYIFSRK